MLKVNNSNRKPLILAAILLGLGQAGFFDGIVFHQLLQWHHMFTSIESTNTVSGLELNTLGDGLFHLVDWLFTLAGLVVCGWRSKGIKMMQIFLLRYLSAHFVLALGCLM